MSKFKIGDIVVIITDCEFTAKENGISPGEKFVIDRHSGPHDGSWIFDIFTSSDHAIGYTEEELELEAVYNSPLYEALK